MPGASLVKETQKDSITAYLRDYRVLHTIERKDYIYFYCRFSLTLPPAMQVVEISFAFSLLKIIDATL